MNELTPTLVEIWDRIEKQTIKQLYDNGVPAKEAIDMVLFPNKKEKVS